MLDLIWKIVEFFINKNTEKKIALANTQLEVDKINADVEKNKDQIKGAILGKGAYWFQLFFVIPLSLWFSGVVLYSLLWCKDCIYPQPFTIAALPPPLNDWAGAIIAFLFLTKGGGR
jgi:hypothetical protein